MPTSYASTVIEEDAQRVWSLVRDFGGLDRWVAALERCEIEGSSSADQVGCVRHLTLAKGGGGIRERLVDLDDVKRSYSYDILESPFAVRRYRATIRVAPVTDTGYSFVEWWSVYDCEAADEPELDRTFARDVFAAGLAGLRSHLVE